MFNIEELEKSVLNIDELDGKTVTLGVTGEDNIRILFAIEEVGNDNHIYVLRVDEIK